MKLELKMEAGDNLNRNTNEPIISLVCAGKGRSYLWVGNNAPDDMMCFATLRGPVALRRLAKAILREVGE